MNSRVPAREATPAGTPAHTDEAAPLTDAQLRATIRKALPDVAFEPRPWRAIFGLLHMTVIGLASALIVFQPMHWAVALGLALIAGNSYASLMFFGHEVAHGSILRSRLGKAFFCYCAGTIFCISPSLWLVWHSTHHAQSNVPGRDPDNFGDMAGYRRASPLARWFLKLAPGSGSLWSVPYLFVFFTVHGQNVLWRKSKDPLFPSVSRPRAALESLAMASMWITIAIALGPAKALFVVVIPMLVANFILLSYITANHLLRPPGPARSMLDVTMNVNTWRWLDRTHFKFSHHIEHHLFPTMGSDSYPMVRKWLLENVPERYISPPHWKAVLMLLRTPRLYADDGAHTVDPFTKRSFALDDITSVLRGEKALSTLAPTTKKVHGV